jgi:hypothetical protein
MTRHCSAGRDQIVMTHKIAGHEFMATSIFFTGKKKGDLLVSKTEQ